MPCHAATIKFSNLASKSIAIRFDAMQSDTTQRNATRSRNSRHNTAVCPLILQEFTYIGLQSTRPCCSTFGLQSHAFHRCTHPTSRNLSKHFLLTTVTWLELILHRHLYDTASHHQRNPLRLSSARRLTLSRSCFKQQIASLYWPSNVN